MPSGERRRLSQVVHDHKGNAKVVWHDAPADYERPVLEIEGGRKAPAGTRSLKTGSLSIETQDTHDPYARVPDLDRKGGPGRPKDLRKLSAWIKLMRQLEESRQKTGKDDE